MELRYCEECGDVIQVESAEPLGELEHFICERCKSGEREPKNEATGEAAGESAGEDLQAQSLNLFSPQTIALRKKQYEAVLPKDPKSNRLRLVKQDATDSPAEGTGAAMPAQGARKILFRCLHCKATLAIRPVDRTSKLNCPHCSKTIFVTAAGTLLKDSPSAVERATEVRPAAHATSGPSVSDPLSSNAMAAGAEPRKPTSSVGFRATASRDAAPPLAGSSSPNDSRRLSKEPPRAAPSQPRAESIGLKTVNPATSWMPKQTSAFDEHRELQDPEKTAFITDESTEDLDDLASSKALAGVAEQFSLPSLKDTPPPPSPRLGALLPDDDVDMTGGSRHAVSSKTRPRSKSAPARREPVCVGRPSILHVLGRGLIIAACLSAPAGLAMTFLHEEASAKGNETTAETKDKVGPLEHLGRIAEKGILRLKGGSE
jgi:DNA-directed RNA polymerase subunit RPC12/RpoP